VGFQWGSSGVPLGFNPQVTPQGAIKEPSRSNQGAAKEQSMKNIKKLQKVSKKLAKVS